MAEERSGHLRVSRRESGASEITRRQLLGGGALVVGLWVVALASLDRVIAGAWLPRALILVAVTIGVACLLRASRLTLRLSAALGGGLLGAVVWLLRVHQQERLFLWWEQTASTVAAVRIEIMVSMPPMEVAGPTEDLLLALILLAALICALFLVSLNSFLLAGLMPVLVFLATPAVAGHSAHGVLMLAAGVLLVFLVWASSPARTASGLLAAGTALVLAIGVVAVAPATRDRAWSQSVVQSPVSSTVPDVTVALANDLTERSNAIAFWYWGDELRPTRFPLATLAQFSEGSWFPQDELDSDGSTADQLRWPHTNPPELMSDVPEGVPYITIEIDGLVSQWLPLPHSAVGVWTTNDEAQFDPSRWIWASDSNTAYSPTAFTQRGDRYRTVGLSLIADDGWRGTGDGPSAGPDPLYPDPETAPTGLAPYVELPEGVPDTIEQLAREVTAGMESRMEIGFALQDFFRGGEFAYDESAPYEPGADPGNPYAVMEALLSQRSGFCVHYASTFAIMARALGVPTRLAVGYATQGGSDTPTSVRGRQLHAWPEIYLDSLGWLAFEPTPGGPGLGELSEPDEVEVPDEADPTETDTAPAPDPEVGADPEPGQALGSPASDVDDGDEAAPDGGIIAWWLGGVLVLVALAAPGLVRRLRTRRRFRLIERGSTPAHHAWDEIRDTATDLGIDTAGARARTAEALAEYLAGGAALRDREAAAAAQWIAMEMTAERYGAARELDDLEDGDGGAGTVRTARTREDLAVALRTVQRELRLTARAGTRLRATVLPRSLTRRSR